MLLGALSALWRLIKLSCTPLLECSCSPLLSSALLKAQLCCLSELPLWRLSERTTFWRVFSTIPLCKPRVLLSQGRSHTSPAHPLWSVSAPLCPSTALLKAELCCLRELPLWRLSERTTFWRIFSTITLCKPRVLLSQGRSHPLPRPPSGASLLASVPAMLCSRLSPAV